MIEVILGIVREGFIYSIMALGVYISLKILDFPDLSVDGTFPLGMAVSTACLLHGINPFFAILISFLCGATAGTVTGFFNVKFRISPLLSGILTMTALYSVNYSIVGKPNEFLPMDIPTVFSVIPKTAPTWVYTHRYLLISFAVMLLLKFLLDWYLSTKSGFLLRSVGDNDGLVVTLAKNPGFVKIIGLSLANGLVATAGSLNIQYIKAFNVSAGTGSLVMGLAAVIIGMTIFGKVKFLRPTTGVVMGMIIYKACISGALLLGLQSKDTNLIVTVLFVATLIINGAVSKKRVDI